jgi:hypothetical protein
MAGMKPDSITSSFGVALRRMWLSWMPRSAVLIGTGHGAHPGAAEIDFQKFRPVRAHQRDTVAGLNPGAQQAGRGCGGDRSRSA